MMRFKSQAILLIAVLLIACKKEKLEGDASIFKGNWNWINTEKITNTCGPDSLWIHSYLDSSVASNNYTLSFLKKGKVIFYHNGGVIWRERIVFESLEPVVSNSYSFEYSIRLDNNENDLMHGFVGDDSLSVDDFPFDTDNDCELRYNHFVRD